jgi:putative ABC transport system substrate-binding protein
VLLPGQSAVPTVARIGVMGDVESNAENLGLFRIGMRNLGWVEGQNLIIVLRKATPSSADPEAYIDPAQDLVRQGVDVIRVANTAATVAATQVTHQIPIVFNMDDPVSRGVVANLAHSGGNATGVMGLQGTGLVAKRLQLLIELVPGRSRVAFLTNMSNPNSAEGFNILQEAAGPLGVRVEAFDARGADDLEPTFAAMAAWPTDGVLEWVTAPFNTLKDRVGQLALQHHLPTMIGALTYFAPGLLAAYAAETAEIQRDICPRKVDQILRGAKPGDLPVELPTRFDYLLSRSTLQSLGLVPPERVLAQVTQWVQ